MIILPAIDIKDKTCVRLGKGDYSTAHKVAEDPLKTAESFKKSGADWIHMVDLDGALDGIPKNREIFLEVAKNSGLLTELGGGIRDMKTIDAYINGGIARVILGSVAVKNLELVKEAVAEFGDKIAVGIDAKNGMVATEGWTDDSTINYIELAKRMEDVGVSYIIYTDIAKDGTLQGPTVEHYKNLISAVSCNIIASGGIRDINDIKALCENNLYGAICGKSLYQGTLSLDEAIVLAK
ncbi:MAG: 1-(5-phosphoribosyl)-5-[Oscillospiraceae bacterium]|nr:1-(5-phosphoribosyl)-5-[(5-phosphoribosylamino)methylideneamino]imidazole-4-carboxamide isomerase [Oscillospiraceae bacterium]